MLFSFSWISALIIHNAIISVTIAYSICSDISVQVMLDKNGISRRRGFVAFSSPKEASSAVGSILCVLLSLCLFSEILS